MNEAKQSNRKDKNRYDIHMHGLGKSRPDFIKATMKDFINSR